MKAWANTSGKARRMLQPAIDRGEAICGKCGRRVLPGQAWDVGHIIGQDIAPHLIHEPSNWRPEHRSCNRSSGATYGNSKRGHPPRPRLPLPPPSRPW